MSHRRNATKVTEWTVASACKLVQNETKRIQNVLICLLGASTANEIHSAHIETRSAKKQYSLLSLLVWVHTKNIYDFTASILTLNDSGR